jgi:molecular chaperone GrpE
MLKKKDKKNQEEELTADESVENKKEEEIQEKTDWKELAEENLYKWKRTVADFENYKKRQAENLKDTIAYANTNLILEILPVIDNFHASTEHIPEEQKDNPWVTGIMYIQKQLEKVLEDNGVSEIVVKTGDDFNPETMEAVKQEESSKKKEESDDKVKKVLMKGYKIDGKVIRAARVTVE